MKNGNTITWKFHERVCVRNDWKSVCQHRIVTLTLTFLKRHVSDFLLVVLPLALARTFQGFFYSFKMHYSVCCLVVIHWWNTRTTGLISNFKLNIFLFQIRFTIGLFSLSLSLLLLYLSLAVVSSNWLCLPVILFINTLFDKMGFKFKTVNLICISSPWIIRDDESVGIDKQKWRIHSS